MKLLILSALLLMSVGCFGQKTYGHGLTAKKNKPVYVDSSYVNVSRDTLFGEISFDTGSGFIKGEGILVTTQVWRMTKTICVKNCPQTDSIGSTSIWFGRIGVSGYSNYWDKHTKGFIKTSKGYESLDFKYEFKPQ